MIEFSEELIKKYQDEVKKADGKEATRGEAIQGLHWLANYADLALKFYFKEQEWTKKLEENPEGFHLTDGTYSCLICGDSISGENSWHDKYGHSCIPCRNARRKGIIPVAAYKDRDSWYRMFEFEINWGVKSQTVRKFIKEGMLKARIVPSLTGRPHYYLFMIKDNKGFLPPKPKSFHIKTGENSFRVEYEKVKSPFE